MNGRLVKNVRGFLAARFDRKRLFEKPPGKPRLDLRRAAKLQSRLFAVTSTREKALIAPAKPAPRLAQKTPTAPRNMQNLWRPGKKLITAMRFICTVLHHVEPNSSRANRLFSRILFTFIHMPYSSP